MLLEGHDLLLLDEPTNHLDAESVLWLERYLADFKGTVVTVTHDRYFLENISEWILELDNGKGLPFEGSYAEWLAAKAVRRAESKRAADAASKAADKELEWLRSAKAGSKTKARLKSYDALVDAARTADDASVGAGAIWIPPGPRLGEEVIVAEGLRKEIGDRVLDRRPELRGAAGVGRRHRRRERRGEVDTHQNAHGPGARDGGRGQGRRHRQAGVGRPGARGPRRQGRPVRLRGHLWGTRDAGPGRARGERARICLGLWLPFPRACPKNQGPIGGRAERGRQLASVVREGGNVLVLDEPTPIDVGTLRALEEAILCFASGSSSKKIKDRVATHILAFEGDSHVEVFNGNWSEYAANRIELASATNLQMI